MLSDSTRGTILLAHGSRDPLWQKPVEAVARRIESIDPAIHVRCAYLELTAPDLPTSAAELVALGATTITIVPLFFGLGKHVREDLPRLMAALQASHPQTRFQLKAAIGEDAQVIELLARIAVS